MKCKLCGCKYGMDKYNGLCPNCWEHLDCKCGLEKL